MKVEVEELAVDEVEVEELAVDEVEVEELAVDEVEVEELAVDEVVVDEVVLDDVPAEPPVPVAVVEPPVPVAVVEPPVPVAVVEPPVPVALAPASDDPPAPVMAEPPAPVMAQPPAPLILDPPPAPAGVVDDTFAVTGTPADEWDTDGDGASTRLPAWYRYSPRRPKGIRTSSLTRGQRIVRLALFTVLAGLIPIVVGARYFQTHGNAGHISGVPLSDAAIAGRVGIQPSDLPGWSASAPTEGNVFAAGATTQGAAAASTAALASTVMARCLHVPVSAVDGAFGMGTAGAQISAQASSPTYVDPAGNGGAVSSVVDVVKTTQVQEADAAVFGNPALFATCYQPFVQAMLPYAGGGTAFATATVQPLVVPVPAGPATETVAAFQIARIANVDGQPKTVIATVTAVFDGRVQATLGTVSDLVFSIDAQNDLVRDLEARTIGVGEL